MLAVVAMSCNLAAAAEEIDNPMYANWAKFKVGSMLKTRSQSIAAEQKMSIDSTATLLEVTPTKLVVEMKTETTSGETKLPTRTRKQDVPAKIAKPADSTIKRSTEDVTVAGTTYTCQVAEETRESVQIKTWTSDRIPGGVVKAEMHSEGLSVTTVLVESSAKK